MGFLSVDLFSGEGLHFVAKIFDVSVGNGIVKDFLDDGFEVGEGMNGGQDGSFWWSQEPTQRTQQESSLDQRQRESALWQLMGMEGVSGARQSGRFWEMLVGIQNSAYILFVVMHEGFHGLFSR